jgi:hypothetical protein
MHTRTSDQLPAVHRFTHTKFDIKRLQAEALQLLHEPYPIQFMQYDPEVRKPSRPLQVRSVIRDFHTAWHQHSRDCTFLHKLRNSTRRALNPDHREYSYHEPTAQFRGTYFEQVTQQFQAQAIRVRLVRMDAPHVLPPHQDFDPTYAVRVIIPIFADPTATNHVWIRGQEHTYHLAADGSAYFLNIGQPHAVIHTARQPRIVLCFSLTDQQDLAEIPPSHTGSNLVEIPNRPYAQLRAQADKY